MVVQIFIPKLGMTMEEATITTWNGKEGDWVEEGSIVLAIETEKISYEIEASMSGFLHIVMGEGNKAQVGAVVGFLVETKEELEKFREGTQVPESLKKVEVSEKALMAEAIEVLQEKEIAPASPAARRLAKELGVDLDKVTGTGPGRRITEVDVKKYIETVPRPPKITPVAQKMIKEAHLDISKIVGTGEGGKITKENVERTLAWGKPKKEVGPIKRIRLEGIRKTIAENMMASLHNSAQVTLSAEVDVSGMIQFRDLIMEKYQKDETVKVSLTDILILATCRSLKRHPMLNSTLVKDEILCHEAVHMGIAMALPQGLIVPVLRDVDKKGLLQISDECKKLVNKAREGALAYDDVTGGTFTVSNMSMFTVDGQTPILRWPEVGLLAMGRIKEKPVVSNGSIVIRPMSFLNLTFDHRVIDGVPAVQFLETVAQFLQHPTLILT